MVRLGASLFLLALAAACTSESPARRVQVTATAFAIDSTTVEVRFTHDIDPASLQASGLEIFAPFAPGRPALEVLRHDLYGSVLLLDTSAQTGGLLYALRLGELAFTGIDEADAPAQVNFTGYGAARVLLRLDTAGHVAPERLEALVTVDPSSGEHTESLARFPLTRVGSVFTATISARIDPERLFAARAIAADGSPAAQLATFRVASADPVHVGLTPVLPRIPEFTAPADLRPGDGLAPVRIVFDDRLARELKSPEVRVAIDEAGRFDPSASRLLRPRRAAGHNRVWEVVLDVAVDPQRTLDGTSLDTFPYVAFLVESGEDIPQRGTTFTMSEETPQVIVIPIGNPALVPVTFRVDVGAALLEPDGRQTGAYPGEGFFLTGEFPSAEDGLGRIAADNFTGGERATLELRERPDAPGIFEKTVFMPPNRPYGWKVVRCPARVGCAQLNRHVASSGRAFPTVMKNLVTENADAAQSPTVRVIDPRHRDRVPAEGAQTADYSRAQVSRDGREAPSTAVMFKQEIPDLVVTVGRSPVTTPIWVVGTWRDVNIPETPQDIIRNGGTLELGPYDYDDGKQGRAPPVRELTLPDDPGDAQRTPGVPAFDASDGNRDASARVLASGAGAPTLWVAWNERELYVATEPAAPGRDHFILVSLDPPQGLRPAQWAKAGRVTSSARMVFLAMEGDGDFSGWFRMGAAPNDDRLLEGAGARSRGGQVLEGALDLSAFGLGAPGDRVWIAALTYGTQDGAPLASQSPMGNANLDVEASELLEVELAQIRAD